MSLFFGQVLGFRVDSVLCVSFGPSPLALSPKPFEGSGGELHRKKEDERGLGFRVSGVVC